MTENEPEKYNSNIGKKMEFWLLYERIRLKYASYPNLNKVLNFRFNYSWDSVQGDAIMMMH